MKSQNAPGVLGGLAVGILLGGALWAQAKPPFEAPLTAAEIKEEKTQTEFIGKILERVKKVKPGQTRADLLQVFTTEGGISTSTRQTYVYRACMYVKVDVEFRNVGRVAPNADRNASIEENSGDIILKISKPYLEYPVAN